ncbi:carboxypeptidase regulatory-like domain-containing protein [bacterium]|nr:carboxypeptidase regulatory-like domain-containing protein [bacterium]
MRNGKSNVVKWAAFVVAGLTALSAWAVSPETVSALKDKVARGERLTSSELRLAGENPMQLASVVRYQDAAQTAPRRPGNPLDIYESSEIEYEWIDITENGTNTGLFDEWITDAIEIGFEFPFYDQTYTQVWICDNGWVSFVQNWSRYWNDVIPDQMEPHCVAYCFWDDLDSGLGSVLYYSDTANERFIISWNNVPHWEDNSEFYSVQMILYANGNIQYNYQDISTGQIGNTSCTVGVENLTSDEALQVCANNDGWLPISGTSLLIAQPDGVPGAPANLQASVNGQNVTLTWTDPTQDTNGNPLTPTNVEVWFGRVDTGTLLGTVAPGVQTYAATGIEDGSRRFSVRAYHTPYFGAPRSVVAVVGTPAYSNNFDTNDGQWVANEGWQWGEVTNPDVTPGFHSSPNVWGTGLAGDYGMLNDWSVDLSPGLAIAGANSHLEFYLYYDCYGFDFAWYDGGNLKISVDGGLTWEVLTPDGGYPADMIIGDFGNPLGGEPGWSGQSSGWEYVTVPLADYAGEVPIFRFHFGSDQFQDFEMSGLFFDDFLIWGMAPPVYSTISGHLTFDGGMGNYSESLVRANGFGLPSTIPAGDGIFQLTNVITGVRQVTATHPDYHTSTVEVTVPEGGATGVEITIVRLDPPAPTNLTGTVDNETGVAQLDWDNSTDPLVDQYRIFRRLAGEEWAQVGTSATSFYQETLTADGIYQYRVTAVDLNVSTPVESDGSNTITVLFGALPVTSVGANGDYDDRIRVTWLEPGVLEGTELIYDDETSEAWYRVDFPNGPQDYFAVRFSPPDDANFPMMIYSANIYMERSDPLPLVAICPSLEGVDGADIDNAWISWNEIGADGDPGWINAVTDGDIFLTEAQDFWVVMQFPPGIEGPGVGSDDSLPDLRSYWTNSYPIWNQWAWHDWMMRVWVGGPPPEEGLASRGGDDVYMLSVGEAGGYAVERVPAAQTVPSSLTALEKGGKATDRKASPVSHREVVERNPLDKWFPPYSRAPQLELRSRHESSALDDIVNYRVYRDSTMIAQPVETNYMDLNRIENTDYSYHITAMYDNGEESPPSPTRVAHCNMEPSPPTNLEAEPSGTTNMVLTWDAPTLNRDGTPLVDLASYQVWRNGSPIATVPAGTTTFIDTPPANDQFYIWAVTAQDEVPNISTPSNAFEGAVVSPWEEVDIEWVDISGIGQDAGISFDDQVVGPFDLGFEFPFMGNTYTEVYMCSNGWASFIAAAWGNYFNQPIPDPIEPNEVIYLFWDDLYPPSGGQFKYYQDGDRFIMSWIDVPHISNTACLYTFQIILEEGGGIYLNYLSIGDDFPSNTWCSIGVENFDGTSAIELLFDGAGMFLPDDNTAVAFWAGPSGQINGLVRQFGNNTPIEGALVTIAENPEIFATTDVTGTYLLEVEPGTYNVTVHKQGFCDQVFEGVVVEDDGTSTRNATMRQPNAHFSVTSLNIFTTSGDSGEDIFEIVNPSPATCEVSYNITTNRPWLQTNPASGDVQPSSAATITVTADAGALQPGDYTGLIIVNHNDDDSPYEIPVNLTVSSDASEHSELPTQFALHTNYPNPFNATTALRFDVPQESHVGLTIFNVQGREVAKPVDGVLQAGFHEISYTANDLPTGMYLIEMEAGSFRAVQKMVLLK